MERREGERETKREGEREREHSGTGCRGIQMSVGVLEKQNSTKQAARCHSYPLSHTHTLAPSRTRKCTHAHACTLHTLRHRLSSTAAKAVVGDRASLTSLVDVNWSLQHAYLHRRRTSLPARTLTLTLLRGTLFYFALSFCFLPFLYCSKHYFLCFLEITFLPPFSRSLRLSCLHSRSPSLVEHGGFV